MRPILLPILAMLAAATPAYATWREASSDHFVIYSEESGASLAKFATRLERYDAAMRYVRGLPKLDRGRASRLTVYVVSNVSAVQRLAGGPGKSVAGFYIPRASGSIAIVPRRVGGGGMWDMDSETVLLHEYAHHFLYQNYSAAYPAWFSEGFAEFHSTAKFPDDGRVGLGLPAAHRAYSLMSPNQLSLDRMMTFGIDKLNAEERESLYARGWLLTHYLTFELSRKGQLDSYLLALNSGKSATEAATTAFGDLKVLGRELDSYLLRRIKSYMEISAKAIETGPIAIRDVGAGEDALMELKIRSRRGVDTEQAAALLWEVRRVAAPFPADPAAQATLAEAEYDAGNYKEAEAAADRALAADPKFMDALIYKGMAKMRMAEGSEDAAQWRDVRRWLIAANRADPDNPQPLILFYRSFGEEGIQATPNSVIGLYRAFELAPQDRDLRMYVARQFLIDGKTREARAALAPIAFDPHAGGAGQAAAAIVAKIDTGSAADALKAMSAPSPEETDPGASDTQPLSLSNKAALRSRP